MTGALTAKIVAYGFAILLFIITQYVPCSFIAIKTNRFVHILFRQISASLLTVNSHKCTLEYAIKFHIDWFELWIVVVQM